MASWTEIPNSSLETGVPARSVDALAFRDNPIAIAEGAVGAPRITNTAFNDLTLGAEKLQTGVTESNWVNDRLTTSQVQAKIATLPVYAVGSYIYARAETQQDYAPGATIAGAYLNPAGVSIYSSGGGSSSWWTGSGIAGSWRCMGYSNFYIYDYCGGADYFYGATLWLRYA